MAYAFTSEMLAVEAYNVQIADVARRLEQFVNIDSIQVHDEDLADLWMSDLQIEPIEWDGGREAYLEPDLVETTSSRRPQPPSDPIYRLILPVVAKKSTPRALTLRPQKGWTQRGPNLAPVTAYVERDAIIVLRGTQSDLANLRETARTMVRLINEDVTREFANLRPTILSMIQGKRTQLIREDDQYRRTAAILDVEVRRRPDGRAPIDVTVRREVQIVRERAVRTPSASDQRLSSESVRQIADLIDLAGKGFEVARREFKKLGEEGLRHVIVGYLNAVFQCTAVTGETFSKDGKPDLVVVVNGRAVLVGECKFWGGAALYAATLGDQLTRYVTWRQPIAVLVTFSTRSNLSGVLAEARRVTTEHASAKSAVSDRSETYFISRHVHPDDDEREMEVHHLFFNLYSTRDSPSRSTVR